MDNSNPLMALVRSLMQGSQGANNFGPLDQGQQAALSRDAISEAAFSPLDLMGGVPSAVRGGASALAARAAQREAAQREADIMRTLESLRALAPKPAPPKQYPVPAWYKEGMSTAEILPHIRNTVNTDLARQAAISAGKSATRGPGTALHAAAPGLFGLDQLLDE